MTTRDRCATALVGRLRKLRPKARWLQDDPGYVANRKDNLLVKIGPSLYEADFERGAGKELDWTERNGRRVPPKIQAAYSSAALVVNSFARWKQSMQHLTLLGKTGFDTLSFEVCLPTGLGGTPPHADLLTQARKTMSIAVESKLLEILRKHRTNFPPSYDNVTGPASNLAYYGLVEKLRSDPNKYKYLDAPQLVKHALGLANTLLENNVFLLYLYWEPMNWKAHAEYCCHREEIARFAAEVIDDRVVFAAMSYQELWTGWKTLPDSPGWLHRHVEALVERYSIEVPIPFVPRSSLSSSRSDGAERKNEQLTGKMNTATSNTRYPDFTSWSKAWDKLMHFEGTNLPDPERRISDVLALWRAEIPAGWMRTLEDTPKRLLSGQRYTRGDLGRRLRGEHALEYEILVSHFERVRYQGEPLIDGVNAYPLVKDGTGGRTGDIELDLLLLVGRLELAFVVAAEVKVSDGNPWSAIVQNLRQLRLLTANNTARSFFSERGAKAEILRTSGAVIAPEAYYTRDGKTGRSLPHARKLGVEMLNTHGIAVHLLVWDAAHALIRPA